MSRQHHREMVAWLEAKGALQVRVERTSRLGHPKLCFSFGGRDWRLPISATAGDRKSSDAMKAVLRHELGIVEPHHEGARRKRQRKPRHRHVRLPEGNQTAASAARSLTRQRLPLNTPFAGLGQLLGTGAA